jgi:hypothetical protein
METCDRRCMSNTSSAAKLRLRSGSCDSANRVAYGGIRRFTEVGPELKHLVRLRIFRR